MVLPEGAAVPIRGRAAPGEVVTVSFLGATCRATADSSGAWRLLLDGSACGGPYTMEITAGNEKIVFHDIYAGDVWLCSGQSNMEMPMQRVKDNFPEEWRPPINALVRQFKVPQEWDFSGPRSELSGGFWKAATEELLDEFSAAAWFFAQALYAQRPRPVGLINAAWGGTPIEAWMSAEALAPYSAKIANGSQYRDDAKRAEITRTHESAIKAWEDEAAACDRGFAEAWHDPAMDISAWGDITLPGDFAPAVHEGFCGVLWLAKDFDVPPSFATHDAQIWLGTIADADTVYVNGVKAGNTTYRYPPRKYPAILLEHGKNRIVIRVTCNSGDGGITVDKPFRIFSHNGTIELAGTWKYQVGAAVAQRPAEFFFQRQSMGLFNAMIAPIQDYPIKGVIWYQGESNDPNPHEYAALFTALINDWRAKRSSPALPFLFVQLPIFGKPEDNNESSSWAVIREAQAQALSLPATGMAAGLDLGEWNDLHPINKKDIGRRLALAAEKTVFNQPNTSPGPTIRAVERRKDRLFISFNNCGKGLVSKEINKKPRSTRSFKRVDGCRTTTPCPPWLSSIFLRTSPVYVSVIAGGKTFRVAAHIKGRDCIAIDLSAIKNPEKILYAWANNPRDRQLFNADGLPALPFRLFIN